MFGHTYKRPLSMKVSVIISTYNSPEWLKKVLWGYECQTYKNFEIIVADDGSGETTRNVIEEFKRSSTLTIVHLWQEDRGFQKSQILNKAIEASSTEYLIFSDGDCIPRNDFVSVHVQYAQQGFFLSGGYFMLPMATSSVISKDDIISGKAFSVTWLKEHGLASTYKILKLTSKGALEKVLNFVTPTKATWNGHNSSGWKKDLVTVNGFNEQMQYGGQDRELGERLMNKGIRGKQIRYSAVCIHLDHKRGYKTEESIRKNKQIRSETKNSRRTWTEHGIVKSQNPV
jgi:glycosyltransferase involved in cell wall biosynthesis